MNTCSLLLVSLAVLLSSLVSAQPSDLVLNDYEPLELQQRRAFLLGFRIEDFVPTAYQCLEDEYATKQEFAYVENIFNFTDLEKEFYNFTYKRNYVYNVTNYISTDVADTFDMCGMSFVDLLNETDLYMSEFNRYDKENERYITRSYPVSALQGLLTNVVFFTNLNKKAEIASESNNTLDFYWLIGRAARVLLVVPPIEIEYFDPDEMDDFDPDFDFGLLYQVDDLQKKLRMAERHKRLMTYPGQEAVEIIQGFGDTTFNQSTQLITGCATASVQMGTLAWFWMYKSFFYADWFTFVSTGTLFLQDFYPVSLKCTVLADAYEQEIEYYKQNPGDIIGYNISYNLYQMYLLIMAIVNNEVEASSEYSKWYNIGVNLGQVLNLILIYQDNYEYPYVTIEYPSEFDEEFSIPAKWA